MPFGIVSCRQLSNFLFLCLLLVIAWAVPIEAATITLRWSDLSTDETGFSIERMPTGGSYSPLATVGANVTNYTDSSVVAGSSYCYRVQAYNSAGASGASNQSCVSVPEQSASAGTSGSSIGVTLGLKPSSGLTSKPGSISSSSFVTGVTTGDNWTDYRVTMQVSSKDKGTIGLIFRYFDNDNYYRFTWNAYNSARRLDKKQNGDFQVLAEDAMPYETGRGYLLEILAMESTLEVQIDGEKIFSVTDSSIKAGGIAFYSFYSLINQESMLDDVVVENLITHQVLLFDDIQDGNLADWTIFD